MEHKGHIEQDDNVYGSEATDEAYMDAEAKANADVNMKAKELESMKMRLQETEEEAGQEMNAKVEKQMGAAEELCILLSGEDKHIRVQAEATE
ncbi:Hypothetical predicted protein [Olea europaea subsp. europaea]|uniref:Uncharacterized protein n=1 Tax=Olea europaea subsp. europaea TaxID=158383 RepID=A0A8S0VG04_OLEEU|nr:Hypothetical predicted protein [Olea europaea subsp. europaea]